MIERISLAPSDATARFMRCLSASASQGPYLQRSGAPPQAHRRARTARHKARTARAAAAAALPARTASTPAKPAPARPATPRRPLPAAPLPCPSRCAHRGVTRSGSPAVPMPSRMRAVISCGPAPACSSCVTLGRPPRLASSCCSVSSEQKGSTWRMCVWWGGVGGRQEVRGVCDGRGGTPRGARAWLLPAAPCPTPGRGSRRQHAWQRPWHRRNSPAAPSAAAPTPPWAGVPSASARAHLH